MEIKYISKDQKGINDFEITQNLVKSLSGIKAKKVLLIPPDSSRMHSGAGKITGIFYELLKDSCHIDIMPALGTHEPMTEMECREFFGGIPYASIVTHNWRNDVVEIGQVSAEYVSKLSEGLICYPIEVEINKRIVDGSYDQIISIGQVVPHEVAGMANYSKNIFVGCGGRGIINKSHMLGAVYGLERIMGRDHSPVRKVFDYAEENFIKDIPLTYVLTVTSQIAEKNVIHGLFIGRSRKLFEEAVKLSQEKNLIFLDKPLKKVIVYLNKAEFKSIWLGNKAIYRTRMAIDDEGELIILAPGVKKFGEDKTIDILIQKYGYVGREKVLELCKNNKDLQDNLSVAAHLIHGSSDGRFSITYAVEKLSKKEVEGVYFNYDHLSNALNKYDPNKMIDGFNVLDNGETVFYISNPSLGLWAEKNKFDRHRNFEH